MANWKEAAEKYKRSGGTPKTPPPSLTEVNREAAIGKAAKELEIFLSSEEGKFALELLEASKQQIIFGVRSPGGGRSIAYFIDRNGLQKSVEPAGTWMAYADAKDIPKPAISPISPEIAISVAVELGRKLPEDVVPWLRKRLDEIAEKAPQL